MPQKLSLVFREDNPANDTPQELGESSVTASLRITTEALRSRLIDFLRDIDDTIEVRVRIDDLQGRVSFAVDCISPAPQEQRPEQASPPHSRSDDDVSTKPPEGFAGPDPVPTNVTAQPDSAVTAREQLPLGVASRAVQRPYSLKEFRAYQERFASGKASLQEHLAGFDRLQETKGAFMEYLTKHHDAMQLKELASHFGCFEAMQNSKRKNAEHVYRAMLRSFVLGKSLRSNPKDEMTEDAVAREVHNLTETAWRQYQDAAAAHRANLAQAMSDPKTLEQFRMAIREKGPGTLSAAQRIRFDELSANESRAARRARIQLLLKSFKGDKVDEHYEATAEHKAPKMERAGNWIASVAAMLEAESSKVLDADEGKLRNAVYRSRMTARMPGHVCTAQAMVETLRNISQAFIAGEVWYLDGVRDATHVDTLITVLRRAKTHRKRQQGNLGMVERHGASEELDNRPFEFADAGFATYPYPAIDRRNLAELVAAARSKPGLKLMSRRLDSYLTTNRENRRVEFVNESVISFLHDYLLRCRAAGIETRSVEMAMQDLKQLRAADIFTPEELRSSLRELIPHLEIGSEDDPS